VSELSLEDDRWQSFASHLDRVGVSKLCGETSAYAGGCGSSRDVCSGGGAGSVATPDEQRNASGVQVGFGERERFVDAYNGPWFADAAHRRVQEEAVRRDREPAFAS
jgi:hypothetical protein